MNDLLESKPDDQPAHIPEQLEPHGHERLPGFAVSWARERIPAELQELIRTREAEGEIDAEPGIPVVLRSGAGMSESSERVRLEADTLREAMRLSGLGPDVIEDTCVLFFDSVSSSIGVVEAGGWVSPVGGRVYDEHGDSTRYKYLVGIHVRKGEGVICSKEEVDQKVYHELAHVKQVAEGTLEQKSSRFNYHDRKKLERVTFGAKAALFGGLLSTWGQMGLAALHPGTLPQKMLERFTDLPHPQTLTVLGLGAMATVASLELPQVYRKLSLANVAHWFHRLNAAEIEARDNQKLAEQFPLHIIADE